MFELELHVRLSFMVNLQIIPMHAFVVFVFFKMGEYFVDIVSFNL